MTDSSVVLFTWGGLFFLASLFLVNHPQACVALVYMGGFFCLIRLCVEGSRFLAERRSTRRVLKKIRNMNDISDLESL